MGQSGMGQSNAGAMLARGGSVLAASLLFLLGVFHFFSGIAAFARDNFYNVGANYPYQVSNTAWGWWHVIGGVALAITGLALLSRRSTWARWVAIVLAAYSVILNFFFLPYFPLWAIVMIPLAIFAIWSLVRDGSEQRQREMMMAQRTTAGAFGGTPTERREPVGAYGGGQTGQRWPENVGGREMAGRDMKEGAGRAGQQAQEQGQQVQSGARGAGQSAEQAADRARQSADRDYRSGT